MPIDVYFKEDIAQILGAVDQAGGGTAALVNGEIERAVREGHALETAELADHLRIYRQGYRDALHAVATAFGIVAARTRPKERDWVLNKGQHGGALAEKSGVEKRQGEGTLDQVVFQVRRSYVE